MLIFSIILFSNFFVLKVSAEPLAIVTVENVTGKVGEKVEVIVTAENVNGMVGGGLSLYYDPNIVNPTNVERGDLTEEVMIFMPNLQAEDNLRVVWVDLEPNSSESGVLCTVSFELLQKGETQLTIYDLEVGIVVDEEESYAKVNAINGSITVIETIEQVFTPILTDQGVVEWVDVETATSYEVKLYRNQVEINSWVVPYGQESLDVAAAIREAGEGDYTVTVQAKGSELVQDGPVSVFSNNQSNRNDDEAIKEKINYKRWQMVAFVLFIALIVFILCNYFRRRGCKC